MKSKLSERERERERERSNLFVGENYAQSGKEDIKFIVNVENKNSQNKRR